MKFIWPIFTIFNSYYYYVIQHKGNVKLAMKIKHVHIYSVWFLVRYIFLLLLTYFEIPLKYISYMYTIGAKGTSHL